MNYMKHRSLTKSIFCSLCITFYPLILCCYGSVDSKPETSGIVYNKSDSGNDKIIRGNSIIRIEPEIRKMLRNPLSGWVVYGSANATSDYWTKYDNLTVGTSDLSVKVSDYAHTIYIRISWTRLNPRENVYGWDTDENLKWMIENARKRKMKLAFRVVVDSRDKFSDFTPKFVKDAGAEGYETQTGDNTLW